MAFINEQNYVDEAEKAILSLKDKNGKNMLPSMSKLRNILNLTADIYNDIRFWQDEKLSTEICGRIDYLRVRLIYEAGREPNVRKLVERAKLIDILKDIKGSKKNYFLFYRYMEALVAFHKFNGGKEY